jgi:dipeptidyl aminopeptidase/acylaminoacyl peptidase
LFFANRVKKPLLIVHGAQDVTVRMNESGFVYESMKITNHKRTYYSSICCCIG